MNTLYFGDNLEILKIIHGNHPDGCIDLIYIDPPFNSKRNYNVLFENADLTDTKAQKEAFADTWSNVTYIDTINEIGEVNIDLFDLLTAFDTNSRISTDAVSYLTTMAIRIYYMHKILKPSGSFYLHCDPTMSHYLKIVCDIIFGERNFRNEISWLRSQPKSHNIINFSNARDVILRYTKSKSFVFNKIYIKHDPEYIRNFYKYKDEDGRVFRLGDLTNPNKDRPNLTYEFLGVTRVWRWTKRRMEKAYKDGLVVQSKAGLVPQMKRYLDEMPGQPVTNNWDDIEHLHGSDSELLGYPTQKPEALMNRIIEASSNEGDLVADFFCGCGTTIAAAQGLNRQWLGVDISHLAVKLIGKRLTDSYGLRINQDFEIHGFPKDMASARELATIKGGRLEFEDWIIEVLLQGILNERRNEQGFDGYLTLDTQGEKNVGLVEVKSGKANTPQINHFIQTIENNDKKFGVFVCFAEQVTKGMREAAKRAGYFREDLFGNRFDKIQICTVDDLIEGQLPHLPESTRTVHKQATRKIISDGTQGKLGLE